MKSYILELEKAYKKYKSSVYFDKNSAITRMEVVKFESQEGFKDIFGKLSDKLTGDEESWRVFIDNEIDKIGIYSFPKNVTYDTEERVKEDSIVSNIDMELKRISFKEENIQSMIKLPIDLHILSILWIENVGKILDKNFYDGSYGNRLIENDTLEESGGNKEWSPYLFKPYFNEYENWRDKGLNIAENFYSEGKDSLIIMLDIKRFYYSVHFTRDMFKSFVKDKGLDTAILRINDLIFAIIKRYSKLYHLMMATEEGKRNTILPIGFLPSSILANWYLDDFDKRILDRINPNYYGRYVDDMIIVEKVEKQSKLYDLLQKEGVTKHDILHKIFIQTKNAILNEQIDINKVKENTYGERKESEYYIKFNSDLYDDELGKLIIQSSKFNIIYLRANGTKALIDKFRDEIRKNSSEFRLLPDGTSLFLEHYNDIYNLKQGESINKLRGINGIELSKYSLSKFIGKLLTIGNYIEDASESKFYDDIKKILDVKTIIQNYNIWESVLTLCIINRAYNKFLEIIKIVYEAIEKVDEGNKKNGGINNSKCLKVKRTLDLYLESCIYRATSILWGDEIETEIFSDKYIKKIVNNEKPKEMRIKFCETKMLLKTVLSTIIDLYDMKRVYESSQVIRLNNLDDSIKYMKSDSIFDKNAIEDGYRYYPYLITKQDITKAIFLFNGKYINNNCDYKNVGILYNYFNYRNFRASVDRLVETLEYKQENDKVFNIVNIKGDERKKIKFAVANASLDFKNFSERVIGKPNLSLKRYNELAEIIKQAVKNKADILVLPESYIPFEWLGLIEREVKKNNMAIITGVEHLIINNSVYNIIASFFPYEGDNYKFVYSNLRTKVHYAPGELSNIRGYGFKEVTGKEYNLFSWNNIWISVFCCFEIAAIKDRSVYASIADVFTVVEWNKDINYFSNIIESLSRDLHCYCVQVNSSSYGDSCVIQPSETYKKAILRTKGGENSSVLIGEVDVDKLRRFQIQEYEKQKQDGSFKQTPPYFEKEKALYKIQNKLFDQLKQELKNR